MACSGSCVVLDLTNSGELRPGSRHKSRFCHIFISLSHLNRPTAVKFCKLSLNVFTIHACAKVNFKNFFKCCEFLVKM